jgi:glycine cleavage system H protein
MHPKFVAARTGTVRQEPLAQMICGMPFPSDRLYHRGHTWARAEKDGTVTVGLDELGKRMLGVPDKMELPELGVRVHTNGTAWRAEKRGAEIRLLSPVDGEVIETGGPDAGWYLKVKPQGAADMRHLLEPSEVEAWMMRELERLQIALGVGGSSVSLADGGVPVDDIGSAYPGADWDTVSGEMFLNS